MPPSRNREPIGDAVVRTLPTARGDEVLVAGLRGGETWAKAALFDRYAPQVERIVRKVLGHDWHTTIEDVVHDAFVQALSSLDSLREPNALLGWLQSIAVHTAYRAIRARKARQWLRFWEPEHLPELTAPGVDVEAREAYRRTYRLLDRLPPDERVAFALRYIDGMELSMVAETCNVSLATIKRRLTRAEDRFAAGARRDPVLGSWLEEGGRWET
jgi:RNA polymerase sigma-70 factor (ECF subfamily)